MMFEEVSGGDQSRAFKVWFSALDENTTYGHAVRSFQRHSGTMSFIMDKYRVGHEQAAFIKALLGPHGYAYAKAIIAKFP
jgi:hypothetical protein